MNVFWFRRDLRIEDNPALRAACRKGEPVIAVFYATAKQWQEHSQSPRQTDLIARRLHYLTHALHRLNIPLVVIHVARYSEIAASLSELCQQHQVTNLYCAKEYEYNEIKRDEAVCQHLTKLGIQMHIFEQKTLIAPGRILTNDGKMYRVFTPFKKAWLQVREHIDLSPVAMPQQVTTNEKTHALLCAQHEANYPVTIASPRVDTCQWPIDDAAISIRAHVFLANRVENYHLTRDVPAWNTTSQLSPYLAIGALSARQCLAMLETYAPSAGAEIWLSELIWRDFYQHICAAFPALSQEKAFVPWTEHIHWRNDDALFACWQRGQTGFPLVDAAMRQLNQTGWMHNRLRMVVASFLVKDLHIDWRLGERYFMSQLIDGDFSANNGGWQWSASTGVDAQPYFRVFNPITQSKKFDPKGEFIRHWLPELNELPDKALHEPQVFAYRAGIRLNYPAPIIDHKQARVEAIALFEQAKKHQQ